MPGSAISVASTSSSAKRAKQLNYRVLSNTSQVDESLFGDPNRVTKRNAILQEKWATEDNMETLEELARKRSAKNKKKKAGKETVQIITKDLIRNLIVPADDPSGESIVIQRSDLDRILKASKFISKEQREAEFLERKRQKEIIMEESEKHKANMNRLDMDRRKNEKLNDLEEEAKENAEHLLSRANQLRQEQDDEIKYLNELILNAKCHAIRDAQVVEKFHIQGEMTEEEKRLDTMMEVDRVNSIKIQEDIEKKRRAERYFGASKLLEQISENEQERLFDLERKDQENVQMQERIEKMMYEDKDALEKKHAKQVKMRAELKKGNEELIMKKEVMKQQDIAEERKVIAYMKQKAEREAALELEQEKVRIEKEKETAKLRALQERATDEQAQKDALRAKRAQEQTEREWRKKESEEARKKADLEAHLIEARAEQMALKEHFLAVEAQRDRKEFERVLRAQKELVEREKKEAVEKHKVRMNHSEEVRAQIREKEKVRIMDRNAFFEEGVKIDEEARMRRQKLEEVKKRKLAELRNAGLAEHYIAGVERKVNKPRLVN